jgi:hypothetical protein
MKLLDIPAIGNLPLGKYKVHLARGKESPFAFDAFLAGDFKEWQESQSARNFQCDTIISLIGLDGDDLWLFGGVYKVLGITTGTQSGYLYETELLPDYDNLIGRIIVQYHRSSRTSYIWGDKYAKNLEVLQIVRERMSFPFPGYNKVIIDHPRLRVIVRIQEPTWKSALSSVNGVYLIVDGSNGKKYVGSATGAGGIWQRWEAYAQIGHAYNRELIELLDAIKGKGVEHVNNFQYCILETADSKATPEFILARESYWKTALLTRLFGYNAN